MCSNMKRYSDEYEKPPVDSVIWGSDDINYVTDVWPVVYPRNRTI